MMFILPSVTSTAMVKSCSALAVLLFAFAMPAQAASPEVPVGSLDGAATLDAVINRMGRASDVSEAGGACGGIVVHDWVAENIRVVTLGNMVDTVAPIRDAQPLTRTNQVGQESKPDG